MAETETRPAAASESGTAAADEHRFDQQVEITEVSPCVKHIKVTIPREIIDQMVRAKLDELGRTAVVPGFRPGKAPARLVQRYLEPQAVEEIRPTLLMASLEQIVENYHLNPITTPNFDPLTVTIPKEGPLVYEFDMEVWPDFPAPTYKGLKLKRPVIQITDAILQRERENYVRRRAGRLIPKEVVEPGDILVGLLTVFRDGRKVGEFNVRLQCSDEVRFQDGIVRNFGQVVLGAKPNEERSFTIELFRGNRPQEITGTAQATLKLQEIYRLVLPESQEEILAAVECASEEELLEQVRSALNHRISQIQREWFRTQIVASWLREVRPELPASVLQNEYRRALTRRLLQLEQAGYTREEIQQWQVTVAQQTINAVVADLYFQMIVQKIADLEKIEVTPEEVDQVVEVMAEVQGESPRRLRAVLERQGNLENIAAIVLQSKVLDFILGHAEIEDVPADIAEVTPAEAEELSEQVQLTAPQTTEQGQISAPDHGPASEPSPVQVSAETPPTAGSGEGQQLEQSSPPASTGT